MKVTALAAPKFNLGNYVWMLELNDVVASVDPTQADIVQAYVDAAGLSVQQYWITHGHHDHLAGLSDLLAQSNAIVRGSPLILSVNQPVQEGDIFSFGGANVEVWQTPGHKQDHVIFLVKLDRFHVFCGDLLFSAGCGRVLDGTIKELFNSINRLNTLPEDTLFYPAHEYTERNLEFALSVEPGNEVVRATLAGIKQNPQVTLPVSLAHERQVNPFLRVAEPEIVERILELKPDTEQGPLGIFSSLRALRNQF